MVAINSLLILRYMLAILLNVVVVFFRSFLLVWTLCMNTSSQSLISTKECKKQGVQKVRVLIIYTV